MNHYELVVKRAKQLEHLLGTSFGATGRGLHEKTSSIAQFLPAPLVRKLRFIATVRNGLIHDVAIDRLDDEQGFDRACQDAQQQLEALLVPSVRRRSWSSVAVIAILLMLGAIILMLFTMGAVALPD